MAKLLSISGLLLAVLSSQAQAHLFLESPNCRGPQKPLQFVTELDKQEFDEKVAKFRQCLESFVGKQNKAIEIHTQSADKAATVWEQYVVKELGQTLKKPETNADAKTKEEKGVNSTKPETSSLPSSEEPLP